MYVQSRILAVLLAACSAVVFAADGASQTIVIRNHRFEPAEVVVPAGQKITLKVKNEDPTPEEFESSELKREKVIKGNSEAVITVGPLKPGTYKFVGEFHEDTAQGRIVAK